MENRKLISNEFVGVGLVSKKVRTPYGLITGEEFTKQKQDLQYGIYSGNDSVMGNLFLWNLPSIGGANLRGLCWALKNINDYQNQIDKYKELIEQDPIVKWHLFHF